LVLRYSAASENSPSSNPEPTNQCTKPLFEYNKPNLSAISLSVCLIPVEFDTTHTALLDLANSELGNVAGVLSEIAN
jgi:hypothetical protein